jgi:hypothetical protein
VAALQTETGQAGYTNQQLDSYPLYGLAELFDTISGKSVQANSTRATRSAEVPWPTPEISPNHRFPAM